MLLTGCTSLRSAQQPVISTQDVRASLDNYKWPAAVKAFHGDGAGRDGLDRRQYRDLVLSQYMLAIDANYAEFRARTDSESRATDLGFDLAILGLTGITAVAEADEVGPLAAAIATFTGARGSFDKNLFFNKTLPAIFAAMDEERAKRRLALIQGMRRDEREYSLPQALPDLVAYQEAGSFALAISKVVAQSVENKNEAVARLDAAIAGCDVVEDTQIPTRALRELLNSTDGPDNSRRDIFAEAFGLPSGLTKAELITQVGELLNKNYCRASQRAAKVEEIRAKLAL